MYVRPQIEEEPLKFGVSGNLWRHALVLFDRQTGSLWAQHSHRCLRGPLAGRELERLPSSIVSWRNWQSRHPSTTIVAEPPPPGWLRALLGNPLSRALGAALLLLLLAWGALRRRRRSARTP